MDRGSRRQRGHSPYSQDSYASVAHDALVPINVFDHSPTIAQRRRGLTAATLALALVSTATAAVPAGAAYGPGADAASARGSQLGGGRQPTLSDDGRYVVFNTSSVELLGSPTDPAQSYTSGAVRRDMVTGAIELVAPPVRVGPAGTIAGVTTGSISGNGRYVIFETPERLTPGDQNASGDVYVRDMTRPLTDASAYELVSALDGKEQAPEYVDDDNDPDPTEGSSPGSRGFSISDDGRRAVFHTRARSNLPTPAPDASLVASEQVLVRMLDENRTMLVTRSLGGGPRPPVGNPNPALAPALSGDGSAVAWIEANVAAQVPLLAGEIVRDAILWRDISVADAPIRRVAGTSDPDDPDCAAGTPFPTGGTGDTGPCYGPFVESEVTDPAISISDDGRRVVFESQAQQRPFSERTMDDLIYVSDMTPGLTRKRGVRRILRGAGGSVSEVTLAGGGSRLAFTAAGSPVFDGPGSVGSLPTGIRFATNVYVVDLAQDIVQRATIGADGSDLLGAPLPAVPGTFADPLPTSLALSDDAGAIAFSAGDGNLFLGDANDTPDVQIVRGQPGVTVPRSAFTTPELPPDVALSGEQVRPVTAPARIHPVISSLVVDRRGIARLNVRVPAAGRVTATASAPRGRKRLSISRASRRTRSEATVHLRLAPTLTARKVARRSRGLRVRINVRYAPTGGRATTAVRSYTLTRSRAR